MKKEKILNLIGIVLGIAIIIAGISIIFKSLFLVFYEHHSNFWFERFSLSFFTIQ